jgi:hypothetical protein
MDEMRRKIGIFGIIVRPYQGSLMNSIHSEQTESLLMRER